MYASARGRRAAGSAPEGRADRNDLLAMCSGSRRRSVGIRYLDELLPVAMLSGHENADTLCYNFFTKKTEARGEHLGEAGFRGDIDRNEIGYAPTSPDCLDPGIHLGDVGFKCLNRIPGHFRRDVCGWQITHNHPRTGIYIRPCRLDLKQKHAHDTRYRNRGVPGSDAQTPLE